MSGLNHGTMEAQKRSTQQSFYISSVK